MSDSTILRIDPLDDANASVWFPRMKNVLEYKKLWHAVEKTPKEGDDNSQARALIILSVKDYHLSLVENATTAKAAWGLLKDAFKARIKARRLQLSRELHALRKLPKESLSEYIGRVRRLRDELTQAGEPMDEDNVVCSLLAGLPERYSMVAAILTSATAPLKLDEAFKQLLAVEQAPKSLEVQELEEQEEVKAFTATRGKKVGNDSRVCYYCGEVGHIKSDCPVKAKAAQMSRKYPSGNFAIAL
jgi:hypothetical protein